jgi:acylphosphatase
MSTDQKRRIETTIEGRVQGVGFRHFTVRTAEKLGDVTGWVRNESDGSVTLVAEGPSDQLEEIVSAVHQGPRSARVDNVETDWKDYQGQFDSFGVRY